MGIELSLNETDIDKFGGDDRLHIYCGLDNILTGEIYQKMMPRIKRWGAITYNFEKCVLTTAVAMMRRALAVNPESIRRLVTELEPRLYAFSGMSKNAKGKWEVTNQNAVVQQISNAIWGKPLNVNSSVQLKSIFYNSLAIPEYYKYSKGKKTISLERDILEKIAVLYPRAASLAQVIMEIRDIEKSLQVLHTELSPEGRFETSFNVAGTETGRWSSSQGAFWRGCVLGNCEVLTRNGWVRIDQFQNGDEAAQWNNSQIEFVSAKLYKTDYDGPLVEAKSEQINLSLTKKHRVLHFHDRKYIPKKIQHYSDRQYKTNPADYVSNLTSTKIPLGGNYLGGTRSYPRFLPMLMADFSKERRGWRGQFKKQRKIDRFISLAKKYNIPFTEQKAPEGYRRFYIPAFKEFPKKWGNWVLDLTNECAKELIEEARFWDGHDRGNGFIFFTVDKEQAYWFATLTHIAGKSATVRKQAQSENSYSTGFMYYVNVKNRDFALVNKKHWHTTNYTGDVYCLIVPSTYFLIRQNGFISVTGNSNIQNIDKALREIFVPDPGFTMFYADLKSAESFAVGYLSEDEDYIEACTSGDIHTYVTRLVWPNLNWTNDIKQDKELAEQIFYRSFSRRFMSKKLGHGCGDVSHEVLTRKGWVPISEKPSEILCWSPTKSEFMKVSHWTDKLYSGNMHEINGNNISLRVTADHRVYYSTTNNEKFSICPASEIPKSARIPLGWGYVGGNAGISPDLARLIAAYQSDGSYQSKKAIRFRLRKQRKIDRLFILAKNLGMQIDPQKRERYRIVTNCMFPKIIDSSFLDWPIESIEAFIDEYVYWDGHINFRNGTRRVFSKDKTQMEWVQTLSRLVGIGGNMSERISEYGTKIFCLQQNHRKYSSHNCNESNIEKVENLRVFCPTVPTGAFYVRRNGKISVTGNSNYLGTPRTLAKQAQAEEWLVKIFQPKYFGGELLVSDLRRWKQYDILETYPHVGRGLYEKVVIPGAFPKIREWHEEIKTLIETEGVITTPLGMRRQFWGRPYDLATLREAVAFQPQSMVGWILNIGLYNVFQNLERGGDLQILANGHDAILGQVPMGMEKIYEPLILREMEIEVPVKGRIMKVPVDIKWGPNWKKVS